MVQKFLISLYREVVVSQKSNCILFMVPLYLHTENHPFGIRFHLALHNYRNCLFGKSWPPNELVALEHGYISKQRFIFRIVYWYPLVHGIPFLFDLLFPSAFHGCIDERLVLSFTEASEVALVRKSSLCHSSFDSVNIVLSARPRQYLGIQDDQQTSTTAVQEDVP
jgi:hypothetical protein